MVSVVSPKTQPKQRRRNTVLFYFSYLFLLISRYQISNQKTFCTRICNSNDFFKVIVPKYSTLQAGDTLVASLYVIHGKEREEYRLLVLDLDPKFVQNLKGLSSDLTEKKPRRYDLIIFVINRIYMNRSIIKANDDLFVPICR
jgi:hypothetical protein